MNIEKAGIIVAAVVISIGILWLVGMWIGVLLDNMFSPEIMGI